jgi:hypothetical protein
MAITNTTLSGAVTATDTVVNVASATGITAPNFQTGTGITWLRIDQESMLVMSVSGTVIGILRGQLGTPAQAHLVNTAVVIGLPSDFTPVNENFLAATVVGLNINQLAMQPIFLGGSADAIPAGVAGNYIIKTAGVDAMTLAAPTLAQDGNVITIFSDTTNAHTLTATSLLANGTALKTTATYPAFRGAGLILKVSNLVYHVLSNGASAGVVVLT